MKYRLGIDLGTNSLGWAAVQMRDGGNGALSTGPLIDLGVRIFSDARNPKDKSSNAAQRRGPRSARRNRDRRLMRGRSMLRVLTETRLFPADDRERKQLQALDPWILRARALDERLDPFDVGRALFHLQERRGFKSNRKTDKAEDGAMFDAIKKAREKMTSSGARTLGELFGKQRLTVLEENNASPPGQRKALPGARVRAQMVGTKMAYDYYPSRALILDEFDEIWTAQAAYHPDLMTDAARDTVRHVIEDQRPLKAQQAGKCTFLEREPRAAKAMPTTHYFRILQEVNNLQTSAIGEKSRFLTQDEQRKLIDFLRKPSSKSAQRTFRAIRKQLNIPDSQRFNLESPKRAHLVGDLTAAMMMRDELWGQVWFDLSRDDQDAIITTLLDAEEFEDFGPWCMETYKIDKPQARAVFDARLPDGHSKLSLAAMARLTPLMERGNRYDEAANEAFGDHRPLGDGVVYDEVLPYYGEVLSRHTAFEKDDPKNVEEKHGKIANPTVHVALNELRKVINDLIKRYGPPEEVVLELARDLPLSDRGLRDLEKLQTKNQTANDERRAELEKQKVADSYKNRLKLRLYEEALQAFDGTAVCVFSGETISKSELFSDDVEVEHILPLSRTLDDSFANKVLAKREANRVKKNQSPAEAFGHSPGDFNWEAIGQRAAQLKSKAWRFAPDAMDKWAERGGDFLARQLNDTRYIARLGKTFVEALYGDQGLAGSRQRVWAVPGQLTADLRHHAGLNTLTGLTGGNRKDRTDHRHHAVDAFVVAMTDRSMVKNAADLAKTEDRVAHHDIMAEMAEPLKRYRNSLEDRLRKLTVSHKPDHGFQDAMHNDTAYGITDIQPKKEHTMLVTRKPLDALSKATDLDQIVDPAIRGRLQAETQGLTGKGFTEALLNTAEAMRPPVRRVRIHTPMKNSSFVTITHGQRGEHHKAYKGDGNYCYDIYADEKGKWTGEVITTFQAYQRAQADTDWWRKKNRADGTPLIMRLRKGDMLEIDGPDGGRTIVVVGYITPGKVAMYEHFEANADGRTRKGYKGDGPLNYIFKAPSSLQRASANFVTVSPSGHISRHNG
ncbi:MAG: type II CRISPR RNA-guided endonuclease Cas9 [Pseudomonadota bacterium]